MKAATLSTLILMVACGPARDGSGASSRTVLQNKGSDTLVNVAQAWAEAYKEVNPNVAIAVTGGGSGTGVSALLNGTVDLANSSRALKKKEVELAKSKGFSPVENIVGYDALAVFLHPSNPIESLSIAQVKAIYAEGGEINKWSGDDFITYIDASAGGYQNASSNPWVYIKFTPNGAEKVEIDDESALESMDWDLSMRRFILRLNGGSSGPSCVGAATFLESTYADLNEVPDGLNFMVDQYYTSDCTLINDSSGLPDNPQVALGAWWTYPGCVATSLFPHLIQLANGSVIKMVVEAYYGSDQDNCNENESPGSDSAKFTIRWTYL